MKEFKIAWGEITLQELSDLVNEMDGKATVDGDRGNIRLEYEEVDV